MAAGKGAGRGEVPPRPASFRQGLLAHVGEQGHEPGTLDGVLDGPLEGGAVAAALAAEELALAGDHLLEALHVLVVDEGRPGAALFRAEAAAVLAAPPKLFPNHRCSSRSRR